MTNFEKDMAVFSFGQHQDFLTYSKRLEEFGYTFNDVAEYIKEKNIAKPVRESIKRTCEECCSPMKLLPLNFSPATLTGEDSKSVWFCINKDCMNTIYNKESVEEIAKKGGT